MKTVHYGVNGLVNTSSKTKVKNALDKLDGVQQVEVDLGRGSIEVMYNGPVTEFEIANCIENTGYEIDS